MLLIRPLITLVLCILISCNGLEDGYSQEPYTELDFACFAMSSSEVDELKNTIQNQLGNSYEVTASGSEGIRVKSVLITKQNEQKHIHEVDLMARKMGFDKKFEHTVIRRFNQ